MSAVSGTGFAPAKVNLYLHVGPPRADGLHPLESIAAFADVGDTLRLEPAERLELALVGPFAAALAAEPEENLIAKAARTLAERLGRRADVRFTLDKRLPLAAGLGGGSSDAGAALRLLAQAWGAPGDVIEAVARGLGADVPVCLRAQTAFMAGAGERTAPVALTPLDAVLANPMAPAPTGAVYRAFDAMGLGGDFRAEGVVDLSDPIPALAARRNDLEAAAIVICPPIAETLRALRELPGARLARLSGSGATAFALFDDAEAAHAAAHGLQIARPGWWVRACRLGGVDGGPGSGG